METAPGPGGPRWRGGRADLLDAPARLGPRRPSGSRPQSNGGSGQRGHGVSLISACAIRSSTLSFGVRHKHYVPTQLGLIMASSTAGRREWTALVVLCCPAPRLHGRLGALLRGASIAARSPTATQMLWIFDIYGFVLAGLLLTMGNGPTASGVGACSSSARPPSAPHPSMVRARPGWLILARASSVSAGRPSCRARWPSSETSSPTLQTGRRQSPSGPQSWPAGSGLAPWSRASSSSTSGGARSSSSTCRSCSCSSSSAR